MFSFDGITDVLKWFCLLIMKYPSTDEINKLIIKIFSTCIFNTFWGLVLQLNASASHDQAKINQKQEQEVHFNVIFIY